MSLRYEQHYSLKITRALLMDLLDAKKTPRVPKSVRERAGHCFRHYPPTDEHGAPIFSQDDFHAKPI